MVQKGTAQAHYQATAGLMIQWLEKVLTWSRRRSSLMMGFDLNDSFGWRPRRHGVVDWARSPPLGPHARSEQHYAANRMLELLERHGV
eukprot:1459823-Pyramimonas_sp.AAC.1